MSRTTWFRVLLVSLVAVLAASRITSAAASSPTFASGTVTYLSASFNNSGHPAGGNYIIDDLTATASYTGTFSGTSSVQGKLILHADGTANFHDVETFTGTVSGVPGTVTLNLNGTTDRTGLVRATDVIVGATGELTDLHGLLDEVGTVGENGPVGTYSGQIQFPNS